MIRAGSWSGVDGICCGATAFRLAATRPAHGLLDDTLVVTAGDSLGRTPRLDSDPVGAGRDHWNQAFCLVLGKLVGSTAGLGCRRRTICAHRRRIPILRC
ncbi:MAG: DUF1501 domain-containing protein [Planctomycetota bacterium]|nr:DUF1501 domain-containing protein [Planctomycetota bacterium]